MLHAPRIQLRSVSVARSPHVGTGPPRRAVPGVDCLSARCALSTLRPGSDIQARQDVLLHREATGRVVLLPAPLTAPQSLRLSPVQRPVAVLAAHDTLPPASGAAGSSDGWADT